MKTHLFLVASIMVVLFTPSLHSQEKTKIKNVLFLISDDLRANALRCYGSKLCHSPHIDALAKKGMLFESAYCQGVACGPSRTSLMRSRYRDKGNLTLGEYFRAQDVYSARVGKIFHMRVPGDIIAGTDGLDVEACWTERFNSPGQEAHTPGDYACLNKNIFTTELEGRESTGMRHRMFVSVSYKGDGSDQPDHKTASKTIELLRKHKDERFFIAAGFVRPHYPMVAPEQYFEPYPFESMVLPELKENDLDDIPKLGIYQSRSDTTGIDQFPDNQKRMWSAYFATIQFMDEQVGRILTELDALGLRDSTAVVFTSDHGYHLGDHTFWQKANLHEQVIRVPLIIDAPGFKSGRSRSIVELVDLFPTLTELMGYKEGLEKVHGKSLVPILKDSNAEVKNGALSFSKGHSWRTKDWAYMRYQDGTEELYHMTKDYEQFTNLAKDPGMQDQKKKLSQALDQRLTQIKR